MHQHRRVDSEERPGHEPSALEVIARIARAEAKTGSIAADLRRDGVPTSQVADVIQQWFVVVLRALARHRVKSSDGLRKFIVTAARNIARSNRRRRVSSLVVFDDPSHFDRVPDAEPSPDQLQLERERRRELLRLLPRLGARDADVVRQCLCEGRNREDVRRALGITRKLFDRILSRAAKRLRVFARVGGIGAAYRLGAIDRAEPGPSGWRCPATALPDLRRRLARSATGVAVLQPGVRGLGGKEADRLVR